MINFPSINIICIGHTCDIGTMEQNKAVGLKRAQAFAQELIDRGVSPDRIECQSKWFSEPLVPNTSEKNREINRRVEIKRK
jgi:outer membrane protein OmpA-like peptidoglycan-associated protein